MYAPESKIVKNRMTVTRIFIIIILQKYHHTKTVSVVTAMKFSDLFV